MMKKILAACLTLVLACSLSAGALAAAATEAGIMPYSSPTAPVETDTSDARLAAVTLKVKQVLDLDTEDYEEFSGNLNENGLVPTWSLYWSSATGSLSVSATEDGQILSLSRYEYDYYRDPYSGVFGPRYPADNSAYARSVAEAFVAQVLDPDTESVVLEQNRYQTYLRPSVYTGSSNDISFTSTIYLNGLPSPLSLYISVREDGTVVNFSRDVTDNKYFGEIPAAEVTATEAAARSALRGTLRMNLEYVLADNGERAILRYLPIYGDEYYVDGDGTLVNLSELARGVTDLYSSYRNTAASPEMAADMGMTEGGAGIEKQLSETELKGVEKLEGVLTKEQLTDTLMRVYPELGLDAFTLSGATYSVARGADAEEVTATLTFNRKLGDGFVRRSVTADAKTADLISVYTSYPWQSNAPAPVVDVTAAEEIAESFLAAHFANELAGSEQTSRSNAAEYTYGINSHSFAYTRKVNGYFYRNDSVSIGIDPTDGSVASFYRSWSDALTFASPEGIVSLDTAIDTYLDTYLCTLNYIAVPALIDGSAPEYRALTEMGYSYFYTMTVGYQLKLAQNTWFSGVDAADGSAVVSGTDYEVTPLTYDDLSGSWAAAAIERLAAYRIGYAGGIFQPAKALTQLDLLTLLVSTNGNLYDLSDEHSVQNIYNSAYSMGLLRKDERNDSKVLTRIEMTKLILDATGYGRVAQLPGIFVSSFSDADQIPAGLYGYAAVAEGLGILRGNSSGACMPLAAATRAEAAAMLDQFMSR